MFRKILIANRGEIAVRVIRACHELGIRTVAIYSDADRGALHVQMADEAFCVGPAPSRDSYLNVPNIMSTAELLNVDAIHPGYGFLAENAHFAEICRDCKIAFIGPSPEAIAKMGNKSQAKEIMRRAGVPVIPGSFGPVRDEAGALATARAIGYPLIIKAAAGGGGRGMRVAHTADDVHRALAAAHTEAEAAFGDGALYVEKYLEEPRHIEIQVLADGRGTVVSLGERDCSVQRRHQKLIEESPSPGVTPRLRRALSRAAIRAAEVVGYASAGTVEFLVDQGEHFYFVEMNTRVQVEHPVTEMVTDVDIVKEQIRVAAGERLTAPREVEPRGHAIECRVNAEDPAREFLPSPGQITTFIPPGGPGVRVDTHAFAGYSMPPFYDSLIAKVIAWGRDRDESITRMTRALREFEIGGIRTTIPFHLAVLDNAFFRRGEIYVNFVRRRIDLSAIRD
jgi:acetyl-CoA carboxylase biotin carboxylase subunit